MSEKLITPTLGPQKDGTLTSLDELVETVYVSHENLAEILSPLLFKIIPTLKDADHNAVEDYVVEKLLKASVARMETPQGLTDYQKHQIDLAIDQLAKAIN